MAVAKAASKKVLAQQEATKEDSDDDVDDSDDYEDMVSGGVG